MQRTYALTENPLVYGFKHISFEITNKICGTNINAYMLPARLGFLARPSFTHRDDSYANLNHLEKAAYYIGRIARFPVTLVGTIADLALQALQSVATTLEYGMLKLESLMTDKNIHDTYARRFLEVFSLSNLFATIREKTTIAEPTLLARDLHLIGEYEKVTSFSSKYRHMLQAWLF